jgi:hypothetical protein
VTAATIKATPSSQSIDCWSNEAYWHRCYNKAAGPEYGNIPIVSVVLLSNDEWRNERIWSALRRLQLEHIDKIAWADDLGGHLVLGLSAHSSSISYGFIKAINETWSLEDEYTFCLCRQTHGGVEGFDIHCGPLTKTR